MGCRREYYNDCDSCNNCYRNMSIYFVMLIAWLIILSAIGCASNYTFLNTPIFFIDHEIPMWKFIIEIYTGNVVIALLLCWISSILFSRWYLLAVMNQGLYFFHFTILVWPLTIIVFIGQCIIKTISVIVQWIFQKTVYYIVYLPLKIAKENVAKEIEELSKLN